MIDIEPILLKMKHRRPVVILAPIVFGLLVGGVMVVKPSMGRFLSIKSEIQGLKQKEPSYNIILESEKKIEILKTRFTGDRTWLIERLNAIAGETGFSIVMILPEEPKKLGEYLERASVRIDAEGSYHQLGEFVSQVESLERYVKILSVDINADTASKKLQGMPAASPSRAKQAGNLYDISMSIALFSAQKAAP